MHKLIFVYKADGTPVQRTFDFFHKLLHPSTYACSLCKITHGPIKKHDEWVAYLETLPIEKEFYFRDAFVKKFPDFVQTTFPAVFISESGKLRQIVKSDELSQMDLKELIEKLKSKIVVRKANITFGSKQ